MWTCAWRWAGTARTARCGFIQSNFERVYQEGFQRLFLDMGWNREDHEVQRPLSCSLYRISNNAVQCNPMSKTMFKTTSS